MIAVKDRPQRFTAPCFNGLSCLPNQLADGIKVSLIAFWLGIVATLFAADAARKWGTYAYTPDNGQAPAVSLSPAKAIDAGGTPAQEVTATVTLRDHSDPCNPPRGIVHAVATTLKNGKVSVLVVMADQGVGDAANDADLLKIAGSLRRTP